MEYALNDIRRIRYNPFVPRGEPLDYKIVQEITERYRKQLDEAIQRAYYGKLEDENDDHIRRCNHCGKPMKEGYYLGGEYACSEECALALYHGDKKQMEEDLSHADEDDGECYWTEWESIYFD